LIGEKSKLIGRDLQPWRAILAIAAWLDSMGVSSLWGKIESLAAGSYQEERIELEKIDINRIALLALSEYVAQTPDKTEWSFSTETIVKIMHRLIDDDEIDLDKVYITPQKIGHRFQKMRLHKREYPRPRQWNITRNGLEILFTSYQIPLPKDFEEKMTLVSGTLARLEELEGLEANSSNYANPSNVELGHVTKKLPINPCYACGSVAWRIGDGGSVVCGVCHPDPLASSKTRSSTDVTQG
jgi:hypothetical protein